jgi:hypothetical protein
MTTEVVGPPVSAVRSPENLIVTGMLVAQLAGTTGRLGGWSELTEVEEAVAAAELCELTAGRGRSLG